jgi:hypothetical protein
VMVSRASAWAAGVASARTGESSRAASQARRAGRIDGWVMFL